MVEVIQLKPNEIEQEAKELIDRGFKAFTESPQVQGQVFATFLKYGYVPQYMAFKVTEEDGSRFKFCFGPNLQEFWGAGGGCYSQVIAWKKEDANDNFLEAGLIGYSDESAQEMQFRSASKITYSTKSMPTQKDTQLALDKNTEALNAIIKSLQEC